MEGMALLCSLLEESTVVRAVSRTTIRQSVDSVLYLSIVHICAPHFAGPHIAKPHVAEF